MNKFRKSDKEDDWTDWRKTSHTFTHTLFLSVSLCLSNTHIHTLSLSFCLCLSYTHSFTHTHPPTHTHLHLDFLRLFWILLLQNYNDGMPRPCEGARAWSCLSVAHGAGLRCWSVKGPWQRRRSPSPSLSFAFRRRSRPRAHTSVRAWRHSRYRDVIWMTSTRANSANFHCNPTPHPHLPALHPRMW